MLLSIEEKIDTLYRNLTPGYCLLFCGYSGLGKTYQALRVASKIKVINPGDSWDYIYFHSPTEVFFDEAQRIPKREQELILKIIDKGFKAIFATTDAGKLIIPILERAYRVNFDFYADSELKLILSRHNINEFQDEIISLSKGNPRRAIKIGTLVVKEGLEKTVSLLGLHEKGLDDLDIKYLRLLWTPRSLDTISSLLGLIPQDIQQNIEPFLLKEELINITQRGRVLTIKGKEYINQQQEGGLL